jgi:hypothetical protein
VAHLRVFRLAVHGQAELAQHLAGGRADGEDGDATERAAERAPAPVALGDLHQVAHLCGVGEQHDVGATVDQRADGVGEGCRVLGQRPLVDRHARHDGAALGEPVVERFVRHAVLLHGDASALDRHALVEQPQQLAPRVRLGDDVRRREPQLGERAHRLGTAGHQHRAAERFDDPVASLFQRAHELPGADAGQEHDDVHLPGEQPLAEGEDLGARGARHLPQRGRHQRLAALAGDEARHLGRHPALERDDAQAGEAPSLWLRSQRGDDYGRRCRPSRRRPGGSTLRRGRAG